MALSSVSSDVSGIMDTISSLGKTLSNFFDNLWSIISYAWSIIETIWYGFTSLVSSTVKLVIEVLNGEAILNTARAFGQISEYIGGPATVFLASLLIIIMLRIFIAFIFKLLRLNIDYNSLQVKNKGRAYKKELSDKYSR